MLFRSYLECVDLHFMTSFVLVMALYIRLLVANDVCKMNI